MYASGTGPGARCDAFGESHSGARDHFYPDLLVDLPCLHYQGELAECLGTYIGACMCADARVSIPAYCDSFAQVWVDGRSQTRVTPS